MRHLRQCFKTMRFVGLAVVTLTWCSGCSLTDALIDGVFLGVSQAVGALLSSVFVG